MGSNPPDIIRPEEIDQLSTRQAWMPTKSGRRVSYYQYGAADGFPAFFCHGTGSHVHAMCLHKTAEAFGYRLIVPDRTGIGLSDFDPKTTLLDEANDIASLADHLRIDRFGLIGLSGGGPTLFAAAHSLPERLEFVVALACAAPLYTDRVASRQLGLGDRIYAKLGKWLPLSLFQIPFGWMGRQIRKNPASFAKMFASSMCPADSGVFQDKNFQLMFLRDWQELFKQGPKGASLDAQLTYLPWGFDLRDIRCRIEIRHGTEDRWVPPSFSRYLASTLPDATLHMIPGQGHFCHLVQAREFFETLARKEP